MPANSSFRYRVVTFPRSHGDHAMSVIVLRNMKIDSLEGGSGDEFRRLSSDDNADHRRTVRGHRCPDPVRRFRRASRAELGVTIGERMEVVISSSAKISFSVA
jgi:hypothetical protein